jgi:hypothetical protein
MKISALLSIHDRYQPKNSVKNNLGDGYLLTYNPIYKKIREGALQQNFKFTSDRLEDYDSFPLAELPNILSKKKIPYVDNVRPLREIEKKIPRQFSLADIAPLKGNQIFHEAAHAIAHTLIKKHLPLPKSKGLQFERSLAFRVLLEESFANACESIANSYATDAIHDEFLFKNSYVMESEAFRKTLRKAISDLGFSFIFRLMLLSFLHANFLKTQSVEQNLIRSLRVAGTSKSEMFPNLTDTAIKQCSKIFRAGLDLDPEFTEFTNRFCLRLIGIQANLQKLFQFDVLANFEKNPQALACLDALTKVLSL